jgi:hypothetical protein
VFPRRFGAGRRIVFAYESVSFDFAGIPALPSHFG